MIQFKSIAFIFIGFINRANFHKSTSFYFFSECSLSKSQCVTFFDRIVSNPNSMFSLSATFSINPARSIISWLVGSKINCELNPFAIIKSQKTKIQLNQNSIFFCFSILSFAIETSRKSINLLWFLIWICSSFFKNHANFCFVRLTFSCAAEHVRAPMRLPWRYIFRFTLWEYNWETENMQWELHLQSKC